MTLFFDDLTQSMNYGTMSTDIDAVLTKWTCWLVGFYGTAALYRLYSAG